MESVEGVLQILLNVFVLMEKYKTVLVNVVVVLSLIVLVHVMAL